MIVHQLQNLYDSHRAKKRLHILIKVDNNVYNDKSRTLRSNIQYAANLLPAMRFSVVMVQTN